MNHNMARGVGLKKNLFFSGVANFLKLKHYKSFFPQGCKLFETKLLAKIIFGTMLGGLMFTTSHAYDFRFKLGIYEPEPWTDENFSHIKSLGVSYLISYLQINSEERLVKLKEVYLPLAQKHGLKVIVNLQPLRTPAKQREHWMLSAINCCKDNPTVVGWYLSDEPSSANVKELKPFYQQLKRLTPNIPVFVCANWRKRWWDAVSICDMFAGDCYSVRDQDFPRQNIHTTAQFNAAVARVAKHNNKPAFAILQAFNFKILPSEIKRLKLDPKKTRMPNVTELRYWIFDALASGSESILFFSYRGALKSNRRRWLDTDLKAAATAYMDFGKLVERRMATRNGFDRKSKIRYAWWKRPGVLVITNGIGRTASAKIRLDLPNMSLRDANGKIHKITNKQLRVNLQPWEVLILKVRNGR